MLAHRLRRWANIEPAVDKGLVLAEIPNHDHDNPSMTGQPKTLTHKTWDIFIL